MTAPIVTLSESQVFTALRAFLLSILPSGYEVIKAQDNRVPEPQSGNFVVMTPLLRERIETNVDNYSDGYPDDDSLMSISNPVKFTVQLDIHASDTTASGDLAHIIQTLFRDETGIQSFADSGFAVAPLYCGDPRQMPFTNENQQVETRWVMEAIIQYNPVVTLPQDFADSLEINLVEVDAEYPP